MTPETEAILKALAELTGRVNGLSANNQMQASDPQHNSCDPCSVDYKMMRHSAARYNDQSANTLASQQQNFVVNQQMVWAKMMGIHMGPITA